MGFCVKCGKKGIEGSLCQACSKEEDSGLKGFKDLTIEICRICNAYRLQGRWFDSRSAEEGIGVIARRLLKKSGIHNPKIKIVFPKPVEELKGEKGKKHLEIMAHAMDERYVLPADLVFCDCPRCTRKKSSYFEAILQLRNPRQEIVDFITKKIERKSRAGIFTTDIKSVRNGIDFYITNKKYAIHLGNVLQNKFIGILKTSARLFTRDRNTQKEVYRVNVLFRALDLSQGEILDVGEDKIKITGVRGERVQGMNIKTRKKVFVDPSQIT